VSPRKYDDMLTGPSDLVFIQNSDEALPMAQRAERSEKTGVWGGSPRKFDDLLTGASCVQRGASALRTAGDQRRIISDVGNPCIDNKIDDRQCWECINFSMPYQSYRNSSSSSSNASRGSLQSSGSSESSTVAFGSGSASHKSKSNPSSTPHNFGNDYNDHYLYTGVLPQSHIMNVLDPLVGYPKLQQLHQLKKAHNNKFACKPFGSRIKPEDMPNRMDTWASEGINFDVVMINGCLDNVPTYETLISLPVQKITPRPSILLLWVPGPALEKGRKALEHWGFRRSEDIVYFVTDTNSIHFPKGLAASANDCVVKSSWHCLMGLKGTLRRSEDSDLINCNVDTDVILEIPQRANVVPEQVYDIVENFSLMSRRLHIIPGYSSIDKPVRVRPGWVVVSPDVLLDNFDPSAYMAHSKTPGFRVPVDSEIDGLRPKTPPRVKSRKP
jgi:N6-adenosine-specific RNA methylase IME4